VQLGRCAAGVGGDACGSRCQGALKQVGVVKAHWECWSECNLSCRFCYRSRSEPLDSDAAKNLLSALAFGGVSQVTFAGGDPSLRRDLLDLVKWSHSLDMTVEVQSNMHYRPPNFLAALDEADLVGFSVDGPSAELHDSVRGKRDNFNRMWSVLERMERAGMPYIVRTLVCAKNHGKIEFLADRLAPLEHMTRWSLVQFTPSYDGFYNREEFEISDVNFFMAADLCRERYGGRAEVNVYANRDKPGVYFMMGPDGRVFSQVSSGATASHPSHTNIVRNHLGEIADGCDIQPHKHQGRYASLLDKRSGTEDRVVLDMVERKFDDELDLRVGEVAECADAI
jgi:MoaA/NifB/PqqE/SkfB family radical SAM enzyme